APAIDRLLPCPAGELRRRSGAAASQRRRQLAFTGRQAGGRLHPRAAAGRLAADLLPPGPLPAPDHHAGPVGDAGAVAPRAAGGRTGPGRSRPSWGRWAARWARWTGGTYWSTWPRPRTPSRAARRWTPPAPWTGRHRGWRADWWPGGNRATPGGWCSTRAVSS